MCQRAKNLYNRFNCCCRIKIKMAPRSDGVKTPKFWKAIVAELLATFWLVLLGCASWIETHHDTETPRPEIPKATPSTSLRVGLGFGGVYAAVVFVFQRTSGGHANPAVTLAFLALRRISIARAVAYVAAQVLGSLIASVFLLVLVPKEHAAELGVTVPAEGVSAEQGFAVELFATALFILVIVSIQDKAADTQNVSPPAVPFIIGLVYAAIQIAAIPLSGGSLNPARSLGPAIVADFWKSHWIYWFGPALGALFGALLYDIVFATDSSLSRVRSCMMAHEGKTKHRNITVPRSTRTTSIDQDILAAHHHHSVIQTQFPEIVVEASASDEDEEDDEGDIKNKQPPEAQACIQKHQEDEDDID